MKSNKYLFYISLLFLTVFIIGGCYQNTQVEQAIQLSKKIDNWNPPKINMTKKQVIQYYSDNREELDPIEGIWVVSWTCTSKTKSIYEAPSENKFIYRNESKIAILRDKKNSDRFIKIDFESLKRQVNFGEINGYFYPSLLQKNSYEFERLNALSEIANKQSWISYKLLDENTLNGIHELGFNYKNKVSTSSTYNDVYKKEPFPFKVSSEMQLYIGSGFFVSESGLVVTNYHVIEDKSIINVFLPTLNITFNAIVALKDKNNDIAILQLSDFIFSDIFSISIPFTISHSSKVRLGQEVFTLGFPLGEILGKSAKLSTGTINSLYGIQDDPRVFQISNPIQPGNSGGPLFNRNGELIGVVFSSLNAKFFYENADIIPQNVNFAIKSDYLLNLISMLPDESEIINRKNKLLGKSLETQIELLAPFIVNIKAK